MLDLGSYLSLGLLNLALGFVQSTALIKLLVSTTAGGDLPDDLYRDVSYRAKFTTEGGAEKIAKVLAACGRDLQPLTDRVPGLRQDMAVEVETLGPVQIATFKEVLASHGKYAGALDAELTPEFALAAQAFYDEYIAICKAQGPTTLRAQRPGEVFCSSLDESLPPSFGMAFYARSEGELKQRAGDLRRGD